MNGVPDPNFVEPHGRRDRCGGFSAARPEGPFQHGSPEKYARDKAASFSDEDGPAIVEFDVPAEIVALANDYVDEIRFDPGFGLEELCATWPTLSKRLILL